MITQIQKCNICGALNSANATTGWVKLWGATIGNAPQPMQMIPRSNVTVDFCPTCAPKTTADKIPAMFIPAKAS